MTTAYLRSNLFKYLLNTNLAGIYKSSIPQKEFLYIVD